MFLFTPDQWPISLRVQLSLMLKSRFPMLIFWNTDLITFYNDAFRPSLGQDGKHPSSLGQRGEVSWAETWPTIGPMIYNIMKGGDAVWFEDQKLPIYRDGKMGYAYWTYSFSPITNDTGSVNGILVTCYETTKAVESKTKLADSEQRFRILIEEAPVAATLFRGPDNVIEVANKLTQRYWGKGPEIVGKPLTEAAPELASQQMIELLAEFYRTGGSLKFEESPLTFIENGVAKEGYYTHTWKALHDTQGNVDGILAIGVDVTEQVKARHALEELQREQRAVLEQQVSQRTEELDTANKQLKITNDELEDSNIRLLHSNEELSQFAYIASHDLQEPLRKISTFSDMLRSSLGENVNETIENYLSKIKSSSTRMGKLITDILNYSKFVKEDQDFEIVNLNTILKNVLSEFDLLIEQKNATIEVAQLPTIDAIPHQMTQLFRNLIGNALKFTRKDSKPEITISLKPINENDLNGRSLSTKRDYFKIEVQDNGIGFPAEHEDKIFNIFKRLHAKSEYEGTGIGLAMCKKIALNHGGDIYALGGEHKGATFYIILPGKQNR